MDVALVGVEDVLLMHKSDACLVVYQAPKMSLSAITAFHIVPRDPTPDARRRDRAIALLDQFDFLAFCVAPDLGDVFTRPIPLREAIYAVRADRRATPDGFGTDDYYVAPTPNCVVFMEMTEALETAGMSTSDLDKLISEKVGAVPPTTIYDSPTLMRFFWREPAENDAAIAHIVELLQSVEAAAIINSPGEMVEGTSDVEVFDPACREQAKAERRAVNAGAKQGHVAKLKTLIKSVIEGNKPDHRAVASWVAVLERQSPLHLLGDAMAPRPNYWVAATRAASDFDCFSWRDAIAVSPKFEALGAGERTVFSDRDLRLIERVIANAEAQTAVTLSRRNSPEPWRRESEHVVRLWIRRRLPSLRKKETDALISALMCHAASYRKLRVN